MAFIRTEAAAFEDVPLDLQPWKSLWNVWVSQVALLPGGHIQIWHYFMMMLSISYQEIFSNELLLMSLLIILVHFPKL